MELEATGIVIYRIFYRQLSANLKIKNDMIKSLKNKLEQHKIVEMLSLNFSFTVHL